MDFKKATERFADKDFDGDPVQIYIPKSNEPVLPPEGEPDPEGEGGTTDGGTEEDPPIITDPPPPGPEETPDPEPPEGGGEIPPPPPEPPKKYHVQGQEFNVIGKRVQYLNAQGELVTESLHDYTKQCVAKQYASMDDFLRKWTSADKKKAVIDELTEHGIFWQELEIHVSRKLGKELDPFDLICHIAFDQPPLTRSERANNVKKRNYFTKYEGVARQVLETLLDKYADVGIEPVEEMSILSDQAFNQVGTPMELVRAFGGKPQYLKAVKELEKQLYNQPQSA